MSSGLGLGQLQSQPITEIKSQSAAKVLIIRNHKYIQKMRRSPAARSSGFRKLASKAAALTTTIKPDVEA